MATKSRSNFALGDAYMEGKGVKQSYAMAQKHSRQAVKQGGGLEPEEWMWGLGESGRVGGVDGDGRMDSDRIRKFDDNTKRYCPLLGQRVVLHGMSGLIIHILGDGGEEEEVNGRIGTAVDFYKNAYTIMLDFGDKNGVGRKEIRVNRMNVAAVSPSFYDVGAYWVLFKIHPRFMVGEYTAATSYEFLRLPAASSVSCPCLDALYTRSSKPPPPPAVPLSPAFYNPSKVTPQPPSSGATSRSSSSSTNLSPARGRG